MLFKLQKYLRWKGKSSRLINIIQRSNKMKRKLTVSVKKCHVHLSQSRPFYGFWNLAKDIDTLFSQDIALLEEEEIIGERERERESSERREQHCLPINVRYMGGEGSCRVHLV